MIKSAGARYSLRPVLALTVGAVFASTTPAQELTASPEISIVSRLTLTDFTEPDEIWRVINDGVMGGISRGAVEMTPHDTLLFTGNLSLENNGGFASCRLGFDPIDLGAFDGIALRVRGDGKRYGFSIRTHGLLDGINHRCRFRSEPGDWTEIRLPFSQFRPEFRGRLVADEPPLDTASVQSVGLIISGGQEGPFRLEIDWIEAYRSERVERE